MMTSRKKLIFFLLFLSQGILFLTAYLVFRSSDTCNLSALNTVTLQEGDLVFRRGKSLESFAVVVAGSNNAFSHIGLIVMEEGKPFVIHAEPGETSLVNDPVKKEPLRSFLQADKASHFAIYRSHLDLKSLERVVAQARIFYIRKYRFDNSYDLLTDQDLYCTELVLKAYQRGNHCVNSLLTRLDDINLLVARRQILMPGAFLTSSLFYKICSR
jgi:hypothetical protein